MDVENNSAFHLQAYQTPSSLELKGHGLTLLAHYGNMVIQNATELKKISTYLVADAYFSKAPFVASVLASIMHLIGRLRDDSVLYYKYKGGLTGKKGCPKKYDGRVVAKQLKMDYFLMEHVSPELQIYQALFHLVSLLFLLTSYMVHQLIPYFKRNK